MGGRTPRGRGLACGPFTTSSAPAKRPARCCASTSRTDSTALVARGPSRTTRRGSSSVRTAPRRSPRRPPTAGSRPDFFATHSIGDLAERSDYWLGQQGRLTEPVYRAAGDDHYRPIGWDAAMAVVANHLRSLASPDRAVFYTSGRTSNEAAFLYQLFARAYGTNNLPDCSNMCHESSGVALGETIGIGKGTVTLDDVHEAELILVVGQNPGTNHPRMLSALQQAKRNGATIVSINPLPEAGLIAFRNPQRLGGIVGRGAELADLHVPVAVAADLALFQWVNRRLVAERSRRPSIRRSVTAMAMPSSSPTSSRSMTKRCSPPPASTRRSPSRLPSACRPRRGSSCVGRWDSPSIARRWRRSARSSTRSCCAARSGVGEPGCVPCAGTATCRVTARWASSSDPRTPCSMRWRHGSRSIRRATTATTRWGRSRRWRPGQVDVFVGLGRQLRRRHTGHRRHDRRPAALCVDRAGVDQAQPLSCPLRR